MSTQHVFSKWRETGKIKDDNNILDFFKQHTIFIRDDNKNNININSFIDDKTRIVLNVMMKNEQTIMARCITSTLPIIDAVCYSDTGSDSAEVFEILRNTVPLSMPLSVEVEPWKNFGFNRTAGHEQTRRFVQRMGWNPNKTYVLCIDADMKLKISDNFDKNSLTHGCYSLQQKNGCFVYWNSRLLRVSNGWFVVGRTHEHHASAVITLPQNLYTLEIDDISDGANRTNKFDRDILLLMEDLADDPNNARSMFYLAESYRNRGDKNKNDYHEAVKWYQKHIDTGSWQEEMFFSRYMIGMCYDLMGNNLLNMTQAYLDAFQSRPHRAEPLFQLGKYYRNNNLDHIALIFFKQASEIPFPDQDILFVDKNIYNYNILFEMGISYFNTKNIKSANSCMQKLLRQTNLPLYWRDLANYNLRYMIQQFAHQESAILRPDTLHNYHSCNPSICMKDSQLFVICRTVNYEQKQARGHKIISGDPEFNTINVLMNISLHNNNYLENCVLNFQKQIQIHKPNISGSNAYGPYYSICQIRGLEDARLINVNGKLCFSCTSLEFTPNMQPRIIWAECDEKFDIEQVSLICGHKDHLTQKNWLPFSDKNNEIYFIYDYSPMTILKFDRLTSQVKIDKKIQIPIYSESWRGSAGPVFIPNHGWLILIHEVCDRPEHRYYMHRFVMMNESFTSFICASDLFYFKHNSGVEMATGMIYLNGNVFISIGVEDSQAFIIKTTWKDILFAINDDL